MHRTYRLVGLYLATFGGSLVGANRVAAQSLVDREGFSQWTLLPARLLVIAFGTFIAVAGLAMLFLGTR